MAKKQRPSREAREILERIDAGLDALDRMKEHALRMNAILDRYIGRDKDD